MNRIEELRIGGHLPSPKGVAMAILEITQRDDATLQELARVVQTDPALSSRLLRLANAPTRNEIEVTSLNNAVMHLGMTSVRHLAMGFSLVDQYSRCQCKTFDYPAFWSHSLFMAVASQELSQAARIGSPDELFACGLLAQIGRLALATLYPDDYAALLQAQADAGTLLARERERLGVDHQEFSAAILADCGIPKALVEPACRHETPRAAGFSEGTRPWQLIQLFALAGRMADLAAHTQPGPDLAELAHLGTHLGLDSETLGPLFDRAVQHWRDWGEILKVPASPLPSFSHLTASREACRSTGTGTGTGTCTRILLVDDEPTTRIRTEAMLRKLLNCLVYTAENGRDALTLALDIRPQIIITDWLMPVMDGIQFCRTLRTMNWGQSMYVIMLTGVETEEQIVEAFEAGVDDYVTKPVQPRALNARMQAARHYVQLLEAWERDRAGIERVAAELALSNRRLEHVAHTDPLTSLPNRRAGMDALSKAWSAAERSGKPLAALVIDVDHFKSVNDRYGHAVGDQVLQEVARNIQDAARKDEFASRIGGEEFLLICHDTDTRSALLAAERLRKKINACQIHLPGLDIQTTVSIGVASRETSMTTPDEMVRQADHALYAAKASGRNRVCLHDQTTARALH